MPITKKSFAVRMDVESLKRLDDARGAVPRERFARDAIMAAVETVETSRRATPRTRKAKR